MDKDVKKIVSELTIEEKAGLCSGENFWQLKSVDRLGLSQIMVTDGPHGLRKQAEESDNLGIAMSVDATCFPTAVTTASSWDVDAMYEMGVALSEECLQEDVSVILGPGTNIKRSPLCGRNFEYISEDPLLAGEMAAGLINGIQSNNIGTSLKHFAMNNQETRRMTNNSVVDERAQREIYLRPFEIAVEKSQPWTIMCSYNKIDGVYASDNKRVLSDILRDEWGYKGLVVSDWGAVNDRVEGIHAGMDLQMPADREKNDKKIIQAVKNGDLSIEELDKVAARVVEMIIKGQNARKADYTYSIDEHRALARKTASESFVLLKNDNDILPLNKKDKVVILGEFAQSPRYQGSGSSLIQPHKVDNVLDELELQGISYTYSRGYDKDKSSDLVYIDEAVLAAKDADIAIVFAGLTDDFESEGFDRTHLSMPDVHNRLITGVAKTAKKTIVVLQNGSPILMPWLNDVDAVLETYLGGETVGAATVDVLFGDVNPSGKLAETFPLSLEDNPSYASFPGYKKHVLYKESIYVGYRYYEKADKDVLFPFGFGLSYTDFEYSNLSVVDNGDYNVIVTLDVKNTGSIAGKEIVELYVKNPASKIFMPEKELQAFTKVELKAGETKTVTLELNMRSFAYYNVNISDWHVQAGEYTIAVGASSDDIRLTWDIILAENTSAEVPDYMDRTPSYYSLGKGTFDVDNSEFEELYGKLPIVDEEDKEFSQNSTIDDISHTFIGKTIKRMGTKAAVGVLADEGASAENSPMVKMAENMLKEMPLRGIGMFAGDKAPYYLTEMLVEWTNGHRLKAIGYLFKRK